MARSDMLAWRSRGSPFRLMTPLATLRDLLRRYGYTVYDIGDERHLVAEPAEDHTPYSKTGWPKAAQYGVGYAGDIMPPKPGSGLPSLQQLGAQILADRRVGVAGISWLKYMNWEPERDWGGPCYQERWTPNYSRRSSSDRGHIHLSGLTGFETSTVASGYDPVARIRGAGSGDGMSSSLTKDQNGALSVAWQAADALMDGQEVASGTPRPVWVVTHLRKLEEKLDALPAKTAEAVFAGLGQPGEPVDALAGALRQLLGPERARELGAALTSGPA